MKLITLLTVGVWIGMLVGISFVEAPLKFQAPGVSVKIGLGIGRLVFSALNKSEIIFSIVLTIWLFRERMRIGNMTLIILGIPILLVTIQSLWLLPSLNLRADQVMQGTVIPNSYHHLLYVIMEISKVIFLTVGFVKIYNYERNLE